MATTCVDRTLSTNRHVTAALCRRTVADSKTGCTTKDILHCTWSLVSKIVWLNLCNRTRQVFLSCSTITDYHNLIKVSICLLKLYF